MFDALGFGSGWCSRSICLWEAYVTGRGDFSGISGGFVLCNIWLNSWKNTDKIFRGISGDICEDISVENVLRIPEQIS